MKSIGRAVHTVGKRLLILRCDPAQLPRMYTDVVDRRMNSVGKVVDVFGNVAAPYAAVFCRAECRLAAGEKVFVAR